MTRVSVTRSRVSFKDMSRDELVLHAHEFLEMRRGLWAATEQECLVGFVGEYRPVYVLPGKVLEGETLYVWFIFEHEGKLARVVNKVADGVYCDAQNGEVYEHPAEWTLVLGSVSRIGDEPLLSREMFERGGRDG